MSARPTRTSFLDYEAVALLCLTSYRRYAAGTGVTLGMAQRARDVALRSAPMVGGDIEAGLELVLEEFGKSQLDPLVTHLTVLLRGRLWPWILPLRKLAEAGVLSDGSTVPENVRTTLIELGAPDAIRPRPFDDLDRAVLAWLGRGQATRALREAAEEYALRCFFARTGGGRADPVAMAIALARREALLRRWNLPDPAPTDDESRALDMSTCGNLSSAAPA